MEIAGHASEPAELADAIVPERPGPPDTTVRDTVTGAVPGRGAREPYIQAVRNVESPANTTAGTRPAPVKAASPITSGSRTSSYCSKSPPNATSRIPDAPIRSAARVREWNGLRGVAALKAEYRNQGKAGLATGDGRARRLGFVISRGTVSKGTVLQTVLPGQRGGYMECAIADANVVSSRHVAVTDAISDDSDGVPAACPFRVGKRRRLTCRRPVVFPRWVAAAGGPGRSGRRGR
jgi:hypothetical protein